MSDSVELNITFNCNWNCDYCISDTHKQKEKSIESVIKEIDEFPEEVRSVSLSGGEPGLLPKKHIDIIIKKLKEKKLTIDLMTNGLFLERYAEYIEYIDEIFYHCVEDPSKKDSFKKYADIMSKENRYYVLVITNENFDDVQYYIDSYNDIKFLPLIDHKNNNIVNINKFLRFLNYNKDRVSDRSLIELSRNIGTL